MRYNVEYPVVFEDDSTTAGLHFGVFGSIQVSKISSNGLHEVFHGIDLIFCCDALSENTVEKISKAWIQVIADNDLFIKDENKYPKEVKIGPFKYAVSIGHNDFKGTIGDVVSAHNSEQLCLKVATRNGKEFHPIYVKSNFMHVLFCAIIASYSIEAHADDVKNFNWKIFSNGVYQVFFENNLEELIKAHF